MMAAKFAMLLAFNAQNRVTKAFNSSSKSADKFGRKADKAFRKASKGGRGFMSRLTSMKTLMAGAGAALITGFIGRSIVSTAKLGDEAAKTSRILGITAEALQELRFAADRQGVSNSILSTSFIALQKRVGELKVGTGSLFTFFNKTGQEALANQLKGAKNVDEAFTILTKAMSKVKNPMDRAALASAAFSRAGVNMLKMMEIGEGGIKALREEAQKYGSIISNDAAKQSEEFIDSMTNMQAALTGVKNTFVTAVIPAITRTMQSLANFLANNKELIRAKTSEFLQQMKKAYIELKPVLFDVLKLIKSLVPIFVKLIPVLATITKVMFIFNGVVQAIAISKLIKKIIAFVKASKLASKIFKVLSNLFRFSPIGLIISAMSDLIDKTILIVKNWDQVGFLLIKWSEKIEATFLKAWDGLAKGFKIAIGFIKKVFFSFIDVYLSVWGRFIRTVLSGVSKVGRFIGLDTSGLDNAVDDIDKARQRIRQESLFPPQEVIPNSIFERNNSFQKQIQVIPAQGDSFQGQIKSTPNQKDSPERKTIVPPNRSAEERRKDILFKGLLRLEGAPPGSTFESTTKGAPPVEVEMVGVNP